MILRSSSTPALGSLLPSVSPENPNHQHRYHHDTTLHPYISLPTHKFSFHQTPSPGSQHFTTLSLCNSSPISPSVGYGGMRRAQSAGNLERLTGGSGNEDASSFFNVPVLDKQMGFGNLETKDDMGDVISQIYLAEGIDVDAGFGCGDGGGGGRNISQVGGGDQEGGSGGGDHRDMEEYYRKTLIESPGNPLLLGNYARFLYQSKKDLQEAEEYYSRAIKMDPSDGEILSQYAKLSWELHRDKDQATSYFEKAVQAASEDSHIHAAYASFLWEIEEEEDEEGFYSNIPPFFNNATLRSTTTA